jgi:hypothetical protein
VDEHQRLGAGELLGEAAGEKLNGGVFLTGADGVGGEWIPFSLLPPVPIKTKQFDEMTVGVAEKNLLRPVGPLFPRLEVCAYFQKMFFPRLEVIHAQRKMIVVVHWRNRFDAPTDEMQFLRDAEPEPRARKIKRRARQRFQPQHVAVKRAASRQVRDMNGDMVEFEELHCADDSLKHGFR